MHILVDMHGLLQVLFSAHICLNLLLHNILLHAIVAAVVATALLLGALRLEMLDGIARQLLSVQQLPHFLLSRLAIANHDGEAGGDVAGDTDAENDGGNGKGSVVVVNAPGGGTKRDLQAGVAVQQYHNGNQVGQGECKVRKGLVGLVETVRLGQLLLVVPHALPLLKRQRRILVVLDGELGGLDVSILIHNGLLGVDGGRRHKVEVACASGDSLHRSAGAVIDTLGLEAIGLGLQIGSAGVRCERVAGSIVGKLHAVFVGCLRDAVLLLLELPLLGLCNLAGVVNHKGHVVRVNGSEGGQAVTHDGEQGHQHAVDDVDGVHLLVADVDPADEEQHPGQTKEGDEDSVERDEEAQRPPHVLAKALHRALEAGSLGVQHVTHAIVQLRLFLLGPALEADAVRQRRVVRVCEPRGDCVGSPQRRWHTPAPGRLHAGLEPGQLLDRLGQLFLVEPSSGSSSSSPASSPSRRSITLGQDVGGATVDPRAKVRHEQGVLHVGQGRKGLDLRI